MGFFSWKTSDTKRSISNKYSERGTFPVCVLCPDGEKLYENNYDGYGDFDGHDIYALVAKWNVPELCNGDEDHDRDIGIDIACTDVQNASLKYPIKIVEDSSLNYDDVGPATSCKYQGYFYDEYEYLFEDDEDEDE